MEKASKAEQYLLDKIRQGSEQAWSEVVDRYWGRLLRFARAKLAQRADAEDIVQDTFAAFIKGLANYRGDCTLETYLFALLRRKIIDTYRSTESKHVCLIQDAHPISEDSDSTDPFVHVAGAEQTASWYVRADEQYDAQRAVLADALSDLVEALKKSLDFRDLQITEMLFYCHLPNKKIAQTMHMNENAVALIKHRSLKQIRKHIDSARVNVEPTTPAFETLLSHVWETHRLSCPKRSTVGAYLLGTLDEDWHKYVDFHLSTLGCRFCRANLEDLQAQQVTPGQQTRLYARILESTVGFLSRPH